MKGERTALQALNAQLTNELTAINQYFLHSRMHANWGFTALAKKIGDESIGEMKHADRLIQRILFLEGLPNLQDLHKLTIGETVTECLALDLKLEIGSRATVVEGIAVCEEVRDYTSRNLLREILDDTEKHIDWLETQVALVTKVGEQNFLQSWIFGGTA